MDTYGLVGGVAESVEATRVPQLPRCLARRSRPRGARRLRAGPGRFREAALDRRQRPAPQLPGLQACRTSRPTPCVPLACGWAGMRGACRFAPFAPPRGAARCAHGCRSAGGVVRAPAPRAQSDTRPSWWSRSTRELPARPRPSPRRPLSPRRQGPSPWARSSSPPRARTQTPAPSRPRGGRSRRRSPRPGPATRSSWPPAPTAPAAPPPPRTRAAPPRRRSPSWAIPASRSPRSSVTSRSMAITCASTASSSTVPRAGSRASRPTIRRASRSR